MIPANHDRYPARNRIRWHGGNWFRLTHWHARRVMWLRRAYQDRTIEAGKYALYHQSKHQR